MARVNTAVAEALARALSPTGGAPPGGTTTSPSPRPTPRTRSPPLLPARVTPQRLSQVRDDLAPEPGPEAATEAASAEAASTEDESDAAEAPPVTPGEHADFMRHLGKSSTISRATPMSEWSRAAAARQSAEDWRAMAARMRVRVSVGTDKPTMVRRLFRHIMKGREASPPAGARAAAPTWRCDEAS